MLKDKMISDMIVHGYSERTIKSYTECMTKLAAFYMISPLKMKPNHIYNFFLHLRKKKLCESSITVFYSSFLLFYTLAKKKYMMKDIPVPKKPTKVATVLNKSEITAFLDHCSSIKEKAIYTLLYSSGIRIGELVKLKIEDIDFERKAIFIKEGKGNKQRYAILSDHAAFLIKQYICGYRPASYLFFSTKGKNHPINMRRIQARLKEICKTAGIIKNATVHTLRHSFASHLLDDGYSIFYIQKLLGHTAINSTLIYLHVNPQYLLQIPSPLEKIHNAKLSIFENHIQYGLDLKMA